MPQNEPLKGNKSTIWILSGIKIQENHDPVKEWSRVYVTRNTSPGRKRKVSQKGRRRLRRTMIAAAFTQEQAAARKIA